MKEICVLGAGGHAQVVADAALASGAWSSVRWFDDNSSVRPVVGGPICGSINSFFENAVGDEAVALGVGDGLLRQRLMLRLVNANITTPSVIHPKACVSRFAVVEDGTVVLAGAVICAGARLSAGVIVNTSASVDHHCNIMSCAHIGPGSHLAGNVNVGELAWVGIGAVAIEGVDIGSRSVIGAGAVVVGDIPAGMMAVGVPARVRGENRRFSLSED